MLAHIKYFYHVAKHGSFSRAAEELFISQPALSRQISGMEKTLGVQLFNRSGRHLQLTDGGRRLFAYAEKIMKLNQEAKKELLELKDLTSGTLTIGAGSTIANYLLAGVLAVYRRRHPGIRIIVSVGNSEKIEQAVLRGQVDLGLIGSGTQNPAIFQEKFADDELFLVVSYKHRFANENNAGLPSQLAKETILLRETGSDTRRLTEQFFRQMDVEIEQSLMLGHTEAIKSGIIHDLGVSFLSKHTWQNEQKLELLLPVKACKIKRPLMVIYLKNTRLSPASLMFAAALKKYSSSPY